MRTVRVFAFVFLGLFSVIASAEPDPANHSSGVARPGVIPPEQVGRRQKEILSACLLGRPAPPFVAQPTLPVPQQPAAVQQPAPVGPQNIPIDDGAEALPSLPEGQVAKADEKPAAAKPAAEKTAATGKPTGANDANQVQLLGQVFAKCVGCHKSSTAGDTLSNFKLTFGEGARNGSPGLKDNAKVLNALKTVPAMKAIFASLTGPQKDALESWASAK